MNSLRYIDEFLTLDSASVLLKYKLFPNSKEITESLSVFTAYREQIQSRGIVLGPDDAIVCVGDGNTPRTAALFACRLPDVQCYSIDPALATHVKDLQTTALRHHIDDTENDDIDTVPITDLSEETSAAGSSQLSPGHNQGRICVHMQASAHPWSGIDRLHVVPHKIQDVRLRCSRAVIVLLHAHVSLVDVQRALHCHHAASCQVVGIIAVPCCNFAPLQACFRALAPDLVYRDAAMLTDKNELRVWSSISCCTAPMEVPVAPVEAITPLSPPEPEDTTTIVPPQSSKNDIRHQQKADRKLRGSRKQQEMATARRLRDQERVRLCVLQAADLSAGPAVLLPECLMSAGFALHKYEDNSLVMMSSGNDMWSEVLEAFARSQAAGEGVGGAGSPVLIRARMRVLAKRFGSTNIRMQVVDVRLSAAGTDSDSDSDRDRDIEGEVRRAARVGDVLEVLGVAGLTSFGVSGLLVRRLSLRELVLPMDVIYTIGTPQ